MCWTKLFSTLLCLFCLSNSSTISGALTTHDCAPGGAISTTVPPVCSLAKWVSKRKRASEQASYEMI